MVDSELSNTFRRLSGGVGLACAAACAAPAPLPATPFVVPPFEVSAELAPGTILGGAGDTRGAGLDARRPVRVALRASYLESASTAGLAPLAHAAAVIADLRGERPLLSLATLLAEGAFATGAAARDREAAASAEAGSRAALLDERTVTLPGGATFSLLWTLDETVEDPVDWLDEFPDRGPILRAVGLWLTATPDGPRVAVSIDDLDPAVEAERRAARREQEEVLPGPPPPRDEEVVRRETVVLDVALAPGEPLFVLLPSPFRAGSGRAFGLLVELDDAAPAEADVAAARAAVAQRGDEHERRTAAVSVAAMDELQREQALIAFQASGGRPALLLLAEESGAALCVDLALVADVALLAELRAALDAPEGASAGSEGASAARGGWALERAAWRLVAQAALEERLDPALEGFLLRHAGALARYPDVLLDALAASADLESFAARLIDEQRVFLEDPDPGARLRAHAWLAARDAAPAGFDPLADREQRRAALEAAQTALVPVVLDVPGSP